MELQLGNFVNKKCTYIEKVYGSYKMLENQKIHLPVKKSWGPFICSVDPGKQN